MLRRLALLALAPLTLAVAAVPRSAEAQEAPKVGVVKTLKGQAFIVGSNERSPAAVGSAVHQNDTIETEEGAALGVTFIDDTTLSMGPKSRITLTKVIFNPDKGDYAFATTLTKGTFMLISGSIAKLRPDAVQIATPVAQLGIRGTKFLVKVDDVEGR